MIKSFHLIILCIVIAIFSVFPQYASASDCTFSDGDIREEFKNCNPDIGIKPSSDLDLQVTDGGSDFREITATIISRVQKITAIIAI